MRAAAALVLSCSSRYGGGARPACVVGEQPVLAAGIVCCSRALVGPPLGSAAAGEPVLAGGVVCHARAKAGGGARAAATGGRLRGLWRGQRAVLLVRVMAGGAA